MLYNSKYPPPEMGTPLLICLNYYRRMGIPTEGFHYENVPLMACLLASSTPKTQRQ